MTFPSAPICLLDTCAYIDIRRSGKFQTQEWAINTFLNLQSYSAENEKLALSDMAVFELLQGLYHSNRTEAAEQFCKVEILKFHLVFPDLESTTIAAQINAKLKSTRGLIGISDVLIAAAAIRHEMTLITSNRRHFERIQKAGFPLVIADWRLPQ